MTGFDSKRQAAMDKLVAIQEELGMYDDQKPEQEPVAWGFRHHDGAICDCISPETQANRGWLYCVPIYDAPPKRKPLSDKEIYSLADSLEIWNEDDEEWILDPNTFARAIEAAYGIKG